MKVIIDTNILIAIIPRRSDYNSVFTDWVKGKFSIAVSTEIYFEYEEILSQKANALAVKAFFEFLTNTNYAEVVSISFKWNLMRNDPDDNKFTDAYIASGADYIISEDSHFDLLKTIPFPPIKVLRLDEFVLLLSKM